MIDGMKMKKIDYNLNRNLKNLKKKEKEKEHQKWIEQKKIAKDFQIGLKSETNLKFKKKAKKGKFIEQMIE